MSQFIHERLIDPVNGDKEVVVCNGVQIDIEKFMELEPGYQALPEGIKGFNYVPGKHHYHYKMDGEVIERRVVSENTLNVCIAKAAEYAALIQAEEQAEEPDTE